MDIAQLERALINADKAGDVEAATVLAAEIRKMRQPSSAPLKIGKEAFSDTLRQVLREADWGTRNIAGAGTALSNLAEGVKQRLGYGNQQNIENNRVIAEEAPVGAIAGNVATYAPLAMVPGANTIAGGAALGAVSGALQPTTEGESVLANTAIGGIAGGAVPAAIRAGKTVKAAVVDPFTEAGRTRIAGGVLNRASADPKAVAQQLQAAQGATQGFNPSVAQATGDAGLAALERTVRAIDPKAWASLDASQRAALADSVRSIAGNPTARQALVDNRENAVKALYDAAKKRVVLGDAELEALLTRPTVAAGLSQAKKIAADEGRNFVLSSGNAGNSLMNQQATGRTYLGQGLHDLKMGIDDAITEGSQGLANRVQGSQLSAKEAYLNWLEQHIPEYGQARQTFANMSQPINQMDIGQNLAERFIPALYRDMPAPAQLNSAALAKALTDQGDDIARQVTGMKGAKLDKVMSPAQMQSLQNVLKDAQAMKAAENVGRGVGSDTVQKTAMSHLAAEAGIPNWLASIARVPGGWAKRAGDVLYGNSDEAVRMQLAHLLQNPQEAAQAMNAAGANPSQLAEMLKRISVGAGQSAVPMLTAQ